LKTAENTESQDRRRRKHDQVRATILSSASRLFAEEGYNSTTVRRIAEVADCSQGTLYTHFVDKQEILRYLCGETFEGLNAALSSATGANGRRRLLSASRIFADFALSHPHHFHVFLMAPSDFGDATAVEYVGREGLNTFHRLRSFYAAAEFQDPDEYGSFVWWNSLKGVVSFILLHRERPFFDAQLLIDQTIATLLRGQQRKSAHATKPESSPAPAETPPNAPRPNPTPPPDPETRGGSSSPPQRTPGKSPARGRKP
jgi:AcrR family transcriptional regulator